MRSKSAQDLLALLRRPLPPKERDLLHAEIRELDQLCSRLGKLPFAPDAAPRIQRARTCASTSLSVGIQHGEATIQQNLERWLAANARVLEATTQARPLNIPELTQLNAAVLGQDTPAPWRSKPAFLDGQALPPAEDVPALMEALFADLENLGPKQHPIEVAGRCHQWIISVHPFADGNGRTARLAADWILALAGYPPLSFADELDSATAVFAEREENYPPEQAAEVILRGIRRSLACLYGSSSSKPG